MNEGLKEYLDKLVLKYETPDFIFNDPISIPHRYSLKQDVEISGLFAAVFAWGQRKTIINKANELIHLMGNTPYSFVLNHSPKDLVSFSHFKHRTFQFDDLLYFIFFLKEHYSQHASLESAFFPVEKQNKVEPGLDYFHTYFFSFDHLARTKKHISTPASGSTCKRLCMYLRWMTRSSKNGVDFGLWKRIKSKDLMMPLDLHVHRIAVHLNLLTEKQKDWNAVKVLTNRLKIFNPNDPVKYDFALFNLSIDKPKVEST